MTPRKPAPRQAPPRNLLPGVRIPGEPGGGKGKLPHRPDLGLGAAPVPPVPAIPSVPPVRTTKVTATGTRTAALRGTRKSKAK
jgi:hypothetical protein